MIPHDAGSSCARHERTIAAPPLEALLDATGYQPDQGAAGRMQRPGSPPVAGPRPNRSGSDPHVSSDKTGHPECDCCRISGQHCDTGDPTGGLETPTGRIRRGWFAPGDHGRSTKSTDPHCNPATGSRQAAAEVSAAGCRKRLVHRTTTKEADPANGGPPNSFGPQPCSKGACQNVRLFVHGLRCACRQHLSDHARAGGFSLCTLPLACPLQPSPQSDRTTAGGPGGAIECVGQRSCDLSRLASRSNIST